MHKSSFDLLSVLYSNEVTDDFVNWQLINVILKPKYKVVARQRFNEHLSSIHKQRKRKC